MNFIAFRINLCWQSPRWQLENDVIAECWDYLERYKAIFRGALHQNVLIALNSQWDWYIRKLADFIAFARNHVRSPMLLGKPKKAFGRISIQSIVDQLETLEQVCHVRFNLLKVDLENLKEMSLVRNLGLHNRWEVDKEYLKRSSFRALAEGELRVVQEVELQS